MMRTCTLCEQSKPLDEFPKDSRSNQGRYPHCKTCRSLKRRREYLSPEVRSKHLERLKKRAPSTTYNRKYKDQRKTDPEFRLKESARRSVKKAVLCGKLPKAKDSACSSCGKPADHYHHHKGYDKPNWRNVLAVCVACHALERRKPLT